MKPLPTRSPKRVHLPRRGVPTRRVGNEQSGLTLFKPHGFVAVQSRQLSLGEQIAMCRGSTFHGAHSPSGLLGACCA